MSWTTGEYEYPIPRRTWYSTLMETESYVHETIMYLISILEGEENVSMELSKLTVELCKRGNTKPLKKVAGGDSIEERVLAFIWQHPAIFETNGKIVSLQPMSQKIDEVLECNLEERLTRFLVFRCNQYGPCQIPISKLMGNLQQASSDIRFHFNNDYSRFYNLLRKRTDIFTFIDQDTVALKAVLDKANSKNESLLKCDEYYLDDRVLNCTLMVNQFDKGLQIVREILATKDIVAIDCEGVNLGAPHGYITLVQLAIVEELPENHTDEDIVKSMKIYLFDVQEVPELLEIALKKLLKSPKITKIFQGCSSDATALYNRYEIITDSVFDTVIAHRHLNEGAKSDLYYLYEHYVGEGTNRMKKDIKKKYISNPRLWTTRPLTELLTYYAAFDVFALIRIFYKMKSQIDEKTYNDIHEKSSITATQAYRRKLPLSAIQMWTAGASFAQIHAELGYELDSEDEESLGITRQKSNDATQSKHLNGSKSYAHSFGPKPQSNRNRDNGNRSAGGGGGESVGPSRNHQNPNRSNYDNGNRNYNPRFSNANGSYRNNYNNNNSNNNNQSHRPNYKNDRPMQHERPMFVQPQSHSYSRHPQNTTNYYNNTHQLQQPQQHQYQHPHQQTQRTYYNHQHNQSQYNYQQPNRIPQYERRQVCVQQTTELPPSQYQQQFSRQLPHYLQPNIPQEQQHLNHSQQLHQQQPHQQRYHHRQQQQQQYQPRHNLEPRRSIRNQRIA